MQQLPIGTDADNDFGKRTPTEVVLNTSKWANGVTIISFVSHAYVVITDRENDHRVEAFVP